MRVRPAASAGRGGAPASLLLLAALASGCAKGPQPPVPTVEYAGCQRAFAGPICMLPEDRRLTLWVAAPAQARIEIEADGRRLESSGVETGLGLRFELDLGHASRRLTVSVDGSLPWDLTLRSPGPTWWEETQEHLASGDPEAALALVGKAHDTGSAEPGRELSARARVAQWKGEYERGRELLERALRAHRASGEHLQEAHDSAALFRLLAREDLGAARHLLAALPGDWNGPAEASYIAAYYPALLAGYTGDEGTAVRRLRDAFEQAERLGLHILWLESGQVLARKLQELGRGGEAMSLSDRLIDGLEGVHPCWRGQTLVNIGWIALLALEAGAPVEDPTELLTETLRVFQQDCRQLPDERLNVTLNLALAHLLAGRLPQARQRLGEAKEMGPVSDRRLALWIREIEARIALEEGRSVEALRLVREVAESAEAGFYPEVRWRAALGEARALAALGRRGEALDAFAEAERRLDAATLMVPLTEGRATFVKQREDGVRSYLDLLLDSGRTEEAAAVALRARSRVLRGVLRESRLARLPATEQERWDRAVSSYRARRAELDAEAADDWRQSQDRLRRREAEREAAHEQLLRDLDDALAMLDRRRPESGGSPELEAGELRLLYHPLPAGWAGFARDAEGLVVRRLDCRPEEVSPARLGECLLEPFADRIAAAGRFRVLAYGFLRQVDFHALPHRGDVLLAAGPVVYGLDLGRPPEEPAVLPPHALIIADPGGDLPAARREAAAVAEELSAADGDWQVRALRGTEAAGAAVRDLLPHVDLLHYSGHAAFAGLGGWESAMPLAGGSRLTVGDVLTLERSPRWVVLSGCETAGSARQAAAQSMSLAHAFLVAGSENVVAATRPVTDDTAFRLIAAFYREWSGGTPVADALRRAQLDLLRDDPQADWAAFRLVVH